MSEESVSNFSEKLMEIVMKYGPDLVKAIVVLIVGLIVIKWVVKLLDKMMAKRNVDASLQPFLKSLIGTLLKVMLLISVIQMLGVETTSFIAILGAAGLAVGMALSGTLQNFAGGVIILILKPFKVGDWIDAQGYSGTVHQIQIFNTILKTPDNKTVYIPNGGLSTGALVNYSEEPTRRVDMVFGIGYGDDIDKAKEIINGLIAADDRILKDPAPAVVLAELADSSVNFNVRPWVKGGDYWGVYFDFQEKVKKAFDEAGVNIPFPQMDVHIQKEA